MPLLTPTLLTLLAGAALAQDDEPAVKDTEAEAAPVEEQADAPAPEEQGAPVEEAPVEEAAVEEAPAMDAPADEAPAEEAKGTEPWHKTGWGFGGVPAVNYNTDSGFGYGILGTLYRYDGKTGPYKSATTFLLYRTTKKVQTHRIDLDMLEVAGKPLRLTTRVEFSATGNDNYCGYGPASTCLEDNDGNGLDDEAEAAADAALDGLDQAGLEALYENLVPAAKDIDGVDAETVRATFIRRYYQVRSIRPNVFLNARYELGSFEVFGSWWASWTATRDFLVDGPYQGSLYEQDYGEGENGFMSTLQAGVMLDRRDNEPAPISGYWIEASLRGATPAWGARKEWSYLGFNATARGYTPVFTERVVLADRLVLDGIFGDPPTTEIYRPGGSQIYSFFGGQRGGRGVRDRGVLGKVRAFNQTELRVTALSPNFGGKLQLDVTPLAFFDQGYWAADWADLGGENSGYLWGTGGGLRLAFNKNFIIRADVGVSPREDYATGIYIDISNLF